MKKTIRDNVPLVLIAGLLLVFAAICLAGNTTPGRSYIRGTLAPSYVNAFYHPGFERSFRSSFTPINDRLKTMRAYAGVDARTVGNGPCSALSYSGVHESILCQRYQDTNGIIPTTAFIQNWKSGSPGLESYLLSHDWQKRDSQPITTLFDNLREARWINYSRGNDTANCRLYIHYEGRPKPTTALSGDNKFYASESCYHRVDFFGGY